MPLCLAADIGGGAASINPCAGGVRQRGIPYGKSDVDLSQLVRMAAGARPAPRGQIDRPLVGTRFSLEPRSRMAMDVACDRALAATPPWPPHTPAYLRRGAYCRWRAGLFRKALNAWEQAPRPYMHEPASRACRKRTDMFSRAVLFGIWARNCKTGPPAAVHRKIADHPMRQRRAWGLSACLQRWQGGRGHKIAPAPQASRRAWSKASPIFWGRLPWGVSPSAPTWARGNSHDATGTAMDRA